MTVLTDHELAGALDRLCRLHGEFTLRSGVHSPVYFDKYLFMSNPLILGEIADRIVDLIGRETQVVAGIELGGVSIATAVSLRSRLPLVQVRKQRKEYGTAKQVEGGSVQGKVVTVIEDVITTGGQVVASAGVLRDHGAGVTDVVCVVQREGFDRWRLREHMLSVRPLFHDREGRLVSAL